MTSKEIATRLMAVNQLDFVDNVIKQANADLVYVELKPQLREILPPQRQVLQIAVKDFTVDEVIRLYTVYVVDYLEESAQLARNMLFWAKKKALNTKKDRQ